MLFLFEQYWREKNVIVKHADISSKRVLFVVFICLPESRKKKILDLLERVGLLWKVC